VGFFSTTIATLEIDFDTESLKDTFVSIVFEGSTSPEDLFQYFIAYLRKIKWNVGNSSELFNALEDEYLRQLKRDFNISRDFGLSFVDQSENDCVLTCNAKFLSNGGVTTSFKGRGPEFFSIISIYIFLQYIMLVLSEEDLSRFALALLMYYQEN
jgi:hypothetical protein